MRLITMFRNQSIRHKLMVFFLLLILVGIVATSTTFLLNEFYQYHSHARAEMKAQASILARNSAAALTFDDHVAADETLSGLKANPRIVAAALFTADNTPFAQYMAKGAENRLRAEFSALFQPRADQRGVFAALKQAADGIALLEMRPLVAEPVILDHQRVGTVFIQTDLHYLYHEVQLLAALITAVSLITFFIAWLLAVRFQQIISEPIIALSEVIKRVSREKNYTLRATSYSADEIGTLIDGFNEMLQEIQNRDRIVHEQQQLLLDEKNSRIRKLTAAVDQSANSIVITTADGLIEYVNPHFCTTTGYAAEEVIGQHLHLLDADNGAAGKYEELWQTVINGGQWRGEFLNRKKSGELFWEQATVSPIMDEQGVITDMIAIKVDITERKQAEEEMRKAKEAAEAASRAKSEFVANMSHEIRTPMNGVIGMSDLMADTPLNEEQQQFMAAIRTSADHLMGIINSILDYSKIEAERVELDKAPFLLRPFLGTALRSVAGKASEKELELTVQVDPQVPDALEGDPGRLRQIVLNLLNNAIKFSGNGEIRLAVQLESRSGNSLTIRFAVTDQGIGIHADKLSRIFESFTQADASTTKTYGGTGLGLAISRRLAELMGGRIWVESRPGVGSTFTFTVQLLERDQSQAAKVPLQSYEGLRAMVVDDNQTNRLYLGSLLSSLGFSVSEADRADTALTALIAARDQESLPTLLLVDLYMPGADGWSLMEALRSAGGFESMHRILMPSVGMRGDAGRCRALGVDGYLVKPVVSEEIHELLRRVLVGDKAERGERWPVTRHQIREERVHLSLLVVDDVEINRMVARAILERMGHQVTVAASGREALELSAATPFDAIFMDVQMPEMDGLQTTAAIRARETSSGGHTPIIAMTAYALEGDRDRCLGAGMDGYVTKPVKAEKIREALEAHLGPFFSEHHSAHEPVPAHAPPAPSEAPVFDRDGLASRLGGDALVAVFVSKFVASMPEYLDKLHLELDAGNAEGIRTAAHTIKGLAANIGAEQLRRAALAVENAAKSGDLAARATLLNETVAAYATFVKETASPSNES